MITIDELNELLGVDIYKYNRITMFADDREGTNRVQIEDTEEWELRIEVDLDAQPPIKGVFNRDEECIELTTRQSLDLWGFVGSAKLSPEYIKAAGRRTKKGGHVSLIYWTSAKF